MSHQRYFIAVRNDDIGIPRVQNRQILFAAHKIPVNN